MLNLTLKIPIITLLPKRFLQAKAVSGVMFRI